MKDLFSAAIKERKRQGLVPVIADIKRISPKDGDLMRGRNPVDIALLLKESGAPALSVVTEAQNFGGSLGLLEDIAVKTSLPVLCKDFFETPEDLAAAKNAGASAVLLICSCLSYISLERLYHKAYELELEVLVETHSEKEIETAEKLRAKIIGINNRDILNLEKDDGTVSTTQRLAKQLPANALVISESGIANPYDVRCAVESGADAVLVGTAILKAEDIGTFYKSLTAMGDFFPPEILW